MSLPEPFLLERYFARHEFTATHLLSSSDCGGWPMAVLLEWADDEAKKLWAELSLGYSDARGLGVLRAEIAGTYCGVEADQVLCVAPQEGVLIALRALLEPGDHVVCGFPAYQSLHELARDQHCLVSEWRPSEEHGWRFDVDELEKKLRPGTKAVIVNFPHNPTGYLPSLSDFKRVVELCEKSGAILFSDEMYRGLEHDPAARLPAAVELSDRAVSLSGLSKVYGLAGLRAGWLATRNEKLYRRFCQMRDYTTICGSSPSEVLALIGLRARNKIRASLLERIKGNLDLLDAFFERRVSEFSWKRPSAGTIGLARLMREPSAADFCDRLVADSSVLLLPSTVYGYGDAHVRFGFGRADMASSLEKLEEFVGSARR